ncbi:unnamed protein product [Sympodiomycopsis kandeliae]
MFRTANPTHAISSPLASRGSGVGSPSTSATPGGVERHATGSSRSSSVKRYPHRLNFYNKPPTVEVTIDEFEGWAIDRLRVLAEIESGQARNRPWPELKSLVSQQMNKYLPLSATTATRTGVDVERERLRDHVSHFVLRLAFCRSEDLQRRFVRTESVLFRLRFESDDSAERERFLAGLDLKWETVTAQEKQLYKDELLAVSPWLSSTWENEGFFKVPWTKVLDLVEKRRVFLRGGVAWVPMREQASLVHAEFTSRLNKDLLQTARSLPQLDEDDRLMPLLKHLSLGFLAGVSSDYNASSTSLVGEDGEAVQIRADMVSALIRKHAPMCMRQMNEHLQERKHLKYQGRMQFGLFLKEMGVNIDQALLFWRRSFASMTDDKFSKEYKYNIRHNYGLEGKRVNYPARSCARIITQDTPGPQDTHGCPFRHYSQQNLSSALSTHYALTSNQTSEILNNVKSGHYHVACTRLFEITHQIQKGSGLDGNGESVAHPNRYFERSWKLEQEQPQSQTQDEDGKQKKESSAINDGDDDDDHHSKPKWTKAAMNKQRDEKSIFATPTTQTTQSKVRQDEEDEFGDGGDDVDFDFDAVDKAEEEFIQRQQQQQQKEQESQTSSEESQQDTAMDVDV